MSKQFQIKKEKIYKGITQKNVIPPWEQDRVQRTAFDMILVLEKSIVYYDTTGFFYEFGVCDRSKLDSQHAAVAIGSGRNMALCLSKIADFSAVDLVIGAAGYDRNTGFDFNYIDVNQDYTYIEKIPRDKIPDDIRFNVKKIISESYIEERLWHRTKRALMKRDIDMQALYPNHDRQAKMLYDVVTERLEKEKEEKDLRQKIQNEIIEELNSLVENVELLHPPFRRTKEK